MKKSLFVCVCMNMSTLCIHFIHNISDILLSKNKCLFVLFSERRKIPPGRLGRYDLKLSEHISLKNFLNVFFHCDLADNELFGCNRV